MIRRMLVPLLLFAALLVPNLAAASPLPDDSPIISHALPISVAAMPAPNVRHVEPFALSAVEIAPLPIADQPQIAAVYSIPKPTGEAMRGDAAGVCDPAQGERRWTIETRERTYGPLASTAVRSSAQIADRRACDGDSASRSTSTFATSPDLALRC